MTEIDLANVWRATPLTTARYLSIQNRDSEEYIFLPAEHLRIASNAVVDAVNGIGPRFIILSMPPRHGKSELISRRTPEWFLANWPHKKVIICGYGQKFATDWGRRIRNDLDRNAAEFGFTLAEDSQAKDRWHTSKGGGVLTAGVGSGITGFGGHLMILDDPIKDDREAYSLTYREDLWKWWQQTARTRLEPGGVIIVVMTRWHSDDIVGRLLSGKPEYGDPSRWREIRFPAICEDDVDILGRKKGQALWAMRYDEKELEGLKNAVGDEAFASLYQQTPSNVTGIGAVYHHYKESEHVIEQGFNPSLDIAWSLDFNVDPMSSVIAQVEKIFTPMSHLTNDVRQIVRVLDEISLPNSNTPEACEEFHARMQKTYSRRGFSTPSIHLYGDAAGSARSHAGPDQSDWEIIRRFLSKKGYRFSDHVPSSDPPVRDRVNSVNRALRTSEGTYGLYIDPKCKQLMMDLKEVRWKRDTGGNPTNQLDKSDKKRTHMSDALGYLIHTLFAVRSQSGERAGLLQ